MTLSAWVQAILEFFAYCGPSLEVVASDFIKLISHVK